MEKYSTMVKKYWMPTLLLIPGIALLVIFFVYPAISMFMNSLREINILKKTSSFIAFSNYTALFSDALFLKGLRNTVVYVAGVTIILVPLSFIVSLLVDCCSNIGAFVRGILYVPSIISMSIAALMWKLILSPQIGVVGRLIESFGVQAPNFLGDPRYALATVIGIGVWRSLGSNTILFIAGLKSMSKEQLEAAEVDGATPLQSIYHIILPNIKYVTAFVTITTVIACFQVFTTIQVLTAGGPNNETNLLVYQVWQQGFRFYNFGMANAISSLLFAVLFGLSLAMIRVLNKREEN